MTWSGCDAVPVEVAEPMNTGPLVNVEPEETTIPVAVTMPEALMFLTTAKSFSVNWTLPAASLVPVGNWVDPIPIA